MAMANDFSSRKPWSQIQTVTWDSQTMVKIPKFYIKYHTPSSGTYSGKPCWEISDSAKTGFHVHPAFVKNNQETDYFLFGAYEASQNGTKAESVSGKSPWVSINYDNSRAACTARNTGSAGSQQYGWHMANVWERMAVSLLCMIECGTPNVQVAIGNGNVSSSAAQTGGSTDAQWRGIHELWGNVYEWVDGFRGGSGYSGGKIRVFDNTGTETYVETSQAWPSSGWTKTLSTATGTKYNLTDGLFAASVDSTEGNGITGDYSYQTTTDYCARVGGYWNYGSGAGLFCWNLYNNSSYTSTYRGFRLACNPF